MTAYLMFSMDNGSSPSFDSFRSEYLQVKKEYVICNNCNWIKDRSFCERCNVKTTDNIYILFDIESQIKEIMSRLKQKMDHFKENSEKFGYLKSSRPGVVPTF